MVYGSMHYPMMRLVLLHTALEDDVVPLERVPMCECDIHAVIYSPSVLLSLPVALRGYHCYAILPASHQFPSTSDSPVQGMGDSETVHR